MGTEGDPSTSRLGESWYHFAPRNIVGNLREAWEYEAARLARAGKPWHSPENAFVLWAAHTAAPAAAVAGAFGAPGLAALALQAGAAIFALQLADYVEHYGLERGRDAAGRPRAKVQPWDSWNADWIATNCTIMSLQRHSHHHAQASRGYHRLASVPHAPQLPMSYPAMFILALAPPLFFRVMNPRVLAQRELNGRLADAGGGAADEGAADEGAADEGAAEP